VGGEKLKEVYNPTEDRKREAKKPAVKPPKPAEKPLEEQVLEVIAMLEANGIVEIGSRVISDKLGLEPDVGRQRVRAIMKKLEADGKVTVEKKAVKEKGARKRYVYRLKENK
jgi:transcription initiation factor IIE alpha subunit